jgi:hypothetical protein
VSIHSDYVLRLVEGLARVMARIAAGRRAGRLDEAAAEIEAAAASLGGIDLRLVEASEPAVVAALVVDPARRDVLARLAAERAELERARGDGAAGARWRRVADALAASVPPGQGLDGAARGR